MKKSLFLLISVFTLAHCSREAPFLSTGLRESTELTIHYEPSPRSRSLSVQASLELGNIRAVADSDFQRLSGDGLEDATTPDSASPLQRTAVLAFPSTVTPVLSVTTESGPEVPYTPIGIDPPSCRCGEEATRPEASLWNPAEKSTPASLSPLFQTGGIIVYRLVLSPVRLSPDRRNIVLDKKIEAHIETYPNPRKNNQSEFFSPNWYQALREIAINGSSLLADSETKAKQMFIIASDDLVPAFHRWMQWKTHLGMQPVIFAVSQIGKDPEAIRNFLSSRFKSAQQMPTYLLLAGDANTLPPYYERTDSDRRRLAASDYPLTLLTDDAIPDISVGRLLASTREQAEAQLEKWIEYEKTNETLSPSLSAGMVIASREGIAPSDEQYARTIEALLRRFSFKSLDVLFESASTATNEQIQAALANGRSWITYFGHGNGVEWSSTNGRFGVQNLVTLPPHKSHPIVVDVSCRGAAFPLYNKSLGQAWVERRDAGAVAYLGSTVDILWHEPAVMAVAMTQSHFEHNNRVLGSAISAGNLKLIERYGLSRSAIDTIKSQMLFGDPSLHTRAGSVLKYSIETRTSCTESQCRITARLRTEDRKPLPGVLATLALDSKIGPLGVQISGVSGETTFEVTRTAALPRWLLSTSGAGLENYVMQIGMEPTEATLP